MKALLRCDTSARIGSGHLSRCLTLARGLLAEGFTVDVATRAPSAHTRQWILREGCGLMILGTASDSTSDAVNELLAAAEGAQLIVLDGYAFGPPLHEALRREDRVVCVIDDLADAPVRGDVVLNGNLYSARLTYDARAGTKFLCGPEYALVREEFAVAREHRIASARAGGKSKAQRLLVTMGGADPTCETEKAIAAVGALGAALTEVKVVVGPANARLEAIRASAASIAEVRIDVVHAPPNMGELMAWCDVALTAAGGTCLELSCVGVAAVAVVVADNQRGVGNALAEEALMDVLERSEASASAIAEALGRLLSEPERRSSMETAQRARVDETGKNRAAARLAELARLRRPAVS